MDERESVIRRISELCLAFLTPEQSQRVTGVVSMALQDCCVTRDETALSTEFAVDNAEYLRRFIALKTIKGCTPKTIKRYEADIGKALMRINKPVPQITTNDIRAYLARREYNDNVCRVTLNGELLCLRTFFQTMRKEEYISRDPTEKVERIKTPKVVKKPFTEIELERLRGGCRNAKQLAIIEVLYSTGCRVSELVGIDKCDLNGDEVLVHGKGQKDRICYLNARAQVALKNYLSTRTDALPTLFPGENICTHVMTPRIGVSSVESMVRRIGKRAGVEGAHPHRFRRTAATTALRRGMPIEQVSKMLGHEQITTTQVYADADQNDLKRSHERYLT